MLRYCSRCGARLELATLPEENRERLACDACGFIAYVNPRLVVTTIPVTADGGVILLRRGIEPGRGWWAQPGGFLEVDETVARGGGARDARGDGAAGRAGRDRRALLAPRGRGGGRGVRGEHRRRRGPDDARGARGADVRARRRSRGARSRSRPRSTRSATGSAGGIRGRGPAAFRDLGVGPAELAVRATSCRAPPPRASAEVDEHVLELGVLLERLGAEVLADPRLLVAAERRLDVDAVVAVDRDDARTSAPSPPAAPGRCRGSRSTPTGRRATRSRSAAPPRPCRTG